MPCFVFCDAILHVVFIKLRDRRNLLPQQHTMGAQAAGTQAQDRTWTGSDPFSNLRECDDFVQYIL